MQLVFDGTDSNTAMIIMGYANTIVGDYQQGLLKKEAESGGLTIDLPRVDLRDRAWFNSNLVTTNYYLPGVIATIVTMMSLLLTSMAIVKEKEVGTMEQLTVSPLRPSELIIGKLLPFAVISLIQFAFITVLGVLWLGLFISTISSTQQEAMMSVFLFYTPIMLLSGFAYPIENMPKITQWFTIFNPLRYFMVIIRNIFLKGVGIDVLWNQLLPLAVMGFIVISLSIMKFRKSLG